MATVMTNDGKVHDIDQDFVDTCRPIKMATTMIDCSDEGACYVMPLPFDSEILSILEKIVKRKKDCLRAMKYLCIK
jgi:hypothetical protein